MKTVFAVAALVAVTCIAGVVHGQTLTGDMVVDIFDGAGTLRTYDSSTASIWGHSYAQLGDGAPAGSAYGYDSSTLNVADDSFGNLGSGGYGGAATGYGKSAWNITGRSFSHSPSTGYGGHATGYDDTTWDISGSSFSNLHRDGYGGWAYGYGNSAWHIYDSSFSNLGGGGYGGWVSGFENSTWDISGSSFYYFGWIDGYDNSSWDISGTSFVEGRARGYGNSTFNISEQSFSGRSTYLEGNDSSTWYISSTSIGGDWGAVGAADYSLFNITESGSFINVSAYDRSTVNISGGGGGRLYVRGGSLVTFYGLDFAVDGGLAMVGDKLLGTGTLRGKWHDGTLFVYAIEQDSDFDGAVTISTATEWDPTVRQPVPVPEPSTLFASIAMVVPTIVACRRRRHRS